MSLRQFDVVPNVDVPTGAAYPLLLVLQSDRLEQFVSRIVAPLAPASDTQGIGRMLPQVTVDGENYIVMLPSLFTIINPTVASVGTVEADRDSILAALGLIFSSV
jgi:hypothetical protein